MNEYLLSPSQDLLDEVAGRTRQLRGRRRGLGADSATEATLVARAVAGNARSCRLRAGAERRGRTTGTVLSELNRAEARVVGRSRRSTNIYSAEVAQRQQATASSDTPGTDRRAHWCPRRDRARCSASRSTRCGSSFASRRGSASSSRPSASLSDRDTARAAALDDRRARPGREASCVRRRVMRRRLRMSSRRRWRRRRRRSRSWR